MRKLFLILALQGSALFAAPPQNEIRIALNAFPMSALYYLSFDIYSQALTDFLLEPLLRLDPNSRKPVPGLTVKFEKRGLREFVFHLNPESRFSDGTPIRSADVLATWDAIQSPANPTEPFKALFRPLEKPMAVGISRVKFRARQDIPRPESLFSNFYILSAKSLAAHPLADFPQGFATSGPYQVETLAWGRSFSLDRNPGFALRVQRFGLDKIRFLSNPDALALQEEFKKGRIDYYYINSTKTWVTGDFGPAQSAGLIRKEEIENDLPHALSAVGWNLRKPLFQDLRVRQALQLLLDRPRMIQDLLFGLFSPITGPFHHRSPFHAPENLPTEFSPARASGLLRAAGWQPGPDQILHKDSQKFEFELVSGSPSSARYLAWYQETLSKMGIKMHFQISDWSTYLKRRSEGRFDALEFSRDREVDATEIGITFGHQAGAANFLGYHRPELNQLLEKANRLPEGRARTQTLQAVDRFLAADAPVAFLWEPRGFRVAYWDRFRRTAPGKYSTWSNLFQDWTVDPEKNRRVELFLANSETGKL